MQFNQTNVFCFLIIFFFSTSLVNGAIFDPFPAYSYALGSYQQANGYPYSAVKSADGFYASCGGTAAVWGC
ncbi:unnamed protein product [Caenorhabditis auriculariae]|uniref:Uncharacterized protein n=1 Tax=Caenorhabditis auriculariae TaxID=2777116 RepID=A0A8S1HQF4_9PELO|nr:unnamed protein product [Caenorhabditis auriculariae]CAD6198867.1 unnamed protein product [Caenorhabditis auriculariae]